MAAFYLLPKGLVPLGTTLGTIRRVERKQKAIKISLIKSKFRFRRILSRLSSYFL